MTYGFMQKPLSHREIASLGGKKRWAKVSKKKRKEYMTALANRYWRKIKNQL